VDIEIQSLLSAGALAVFIWALRFLLPRAVRERDGLALTSAVTAAVLAFLLWLFIGVATRS
jgi:hypothetical protein